MYTVLTLDDEKTYTDFTYNIMITEKWDINDYIYDIQETGEESFKCIKSISEAVIIYHTPIPTQGQLMSVIIPKI